MRLFVTGGGDQFVSVDEAELVHKLRVDAEMWSPSDSVEQYMRESARRATILTGMPVRCDCPENYVADLIASGLIIEISVN